MNDFCKNIIRDLDDEINELSIEFNDPLTLCEKAIGLTIDKIADLKQVILKRGFKDIDEEIHFFKHLKPNILSKLIYYNAIYKIETKKPYGAKPIKKHLKKELKKLKRFFENNLEFYKYYRSNMSFLDENLFVRGKHDIKLWLDTYYFESDHTFSTSHDYKVAKIMANDLIQVYLEKQLAGINQKNKLVDGTILNWTSSKVALIELVYALHAYHAYDNGNVDIKVITKIFEKTFNIDLGEFYHTYMEIKNRKINRTKFLDELRDCLIKKMDEQDEK
ncbi:tetracycline regulation of excision, RteC [Chryseobacterium indologenes]|uniref:RteC domain-containing protein n=1 Tax=Chryseobacterium indologenes TaxID=253 RepID=UPI000B517F1E|nr:RteC domain-containing protein [Chryseobacterium indologenes]ASE60681.1 tetracycline regulation of excision, RteC [Chryseobacterium indologenes]